MLGCLQVVCTALAGLAVLPYIGLGEGRTDSSGAGNSSLVQTVLGLGAFLPCPNQPQDQGVDSVTLVLWFQPPSLTPFYSYDTVEKPGSGTHWAAFPKRHSYSPAPSSQTGLRISGVRPSDSGVYRCRTDYKFQQTVIHWVTLNVIVPPNSVKIYNTGSQKRVGDAVVVTSPESGLALTCEAEGGDPPPAVRWLREGRLIDASFYSGPAVHTVSNSLVIPSLSRADMFAQLTCEAANNVLARPITAATSLHIKYLPTSVKISQLASTVGDNQHPPTTPQNIRLVDGLTVQLQCTVSGAQPSPLISWWRGELRLAQSLQQALGDGTVVSTIHLTPGRSDHGAALRCRAEVPGLKGRKEDTIVMHVAYPPSVRITTGAALNLSSVQEGQDIYLQCHIDANPAPSEFGWLFNGDPLVPGSSPGMLGSGHSLAIQGAHRGHSGEYSCSAGNRLGARRSDSIHLDIKYVPECSKQTTLVYKGFVGQSISVECQVRANPTSQLTFYWTFNSTREEYQQKDSPPQDTSASSRVTFTPQTEEQFGSVSCLASNSVGRQLVPCTALTVPLLAPNNPRECVAHNITHESFHVRCLPPVTSSPPPFFSLTVILPSTGQLVHRVEGKNNPDFMVEDLQAGTSYTVSVVASNNNGESEGAVVSVTTSNIPDMAERRLKEGLEQQQQEQGLSMLVLSLGLGSSLSVLLLLLAVTAVLRRGREQQAAGQEDWNPKVTAIPASLSDATQPENGLVKEVGVRYATLTRGGVTYVRSEAGRVQERPSPCARELGDLRENPLGQNRESTL